MLELDDVELEFTDEALSAISNKAIERKTGARGLRSIIEEALIDIMYDVPSSDGVVKVVITEETINDEKILNYTIKKEISLIRNKLLLNKIV